MKYIVLLASLCSVTLAATRVDPLVSTKVGLIRGLKDVNGYSKFLGVPYGKVGSNIFGAAEPYPAFEDTFEAYDDSNICAHVSPLTETAVGTTECLNLNIYVPDGASSSNRLPVMVWIHGGAFVEGSATVESRDPLSLLRHDVIVVAINYRLGIFGFMCLDTPEVPGNAGLKDQTIALRWIRDNIESFGGNANQITVFGESAGAMSTNLHLLSLNEKLFDRAIIQSGPATSYWMMVESDISIPFRLAAHLGFNTTDMNEALSFLANTNVHLLAYAGHDLMISNSEGTNQPLTKPCIEKEFEGVTNFLTEHPMNIISSKAATTPVIIGYNNIEFAFQYANVDAEFFNTYDFSQHFALGFDMSNDITEALQVVKNYYIADQNISEKVRWEIIDFGSDFIFNHPTQRMVEKLLESGASTVYRYVFSYDGTFEINKTWSGATHAEDLPYVFDLYTSDQEKSSEDQLVIDRFTTLWTNFAKYGDPTPNTSELLPVKWTPVTKTTHPYLEINSELNMKSRPFFGRMAFWDLFYKKYGQYQKWYKA